MSFHDQSGKVLYKTLSPLMRMLLRPSMVRVRVLVINDDKEVLLIRSWFGRQSWSLPGGGIGLGEEPKAAAVRETKEEAGIIITMSDLKDLGIIFSDDPNIRCQFQIYETRANGTPKVNGLIHKIEILEAQWFPLTNLPTNLSPMVGRVLSEAHYI